MRYTIVSHHLLRRRARAKKRALEREDPRSVFQVVKAKDAAGNASAASAPVSATPQGVVAGANRVPFSVAQSPFNRTLVEKFPSGIPIAALNETYVLGMENRSGQQPYVWWGNDVSQYTLAVYVVDSSWLVGTPTQLDYSGIHGEASESSVTQQAGGAGSPYTFPFRVPASLKPAEGDDGQFVLWDRDNVLAHASGPQFWDIWQIPRNPDGTWEADVNGRMQCTNFTHAIGELASDGAYTAGPVAYPSRGPGFPYMAGLALSTVVCFTTCRGNQTVTKDAASTLLGTANYVGSGSGANVPAITASSVVGGGDVTLAPTVGAAAELNVFAYEVT